ncbi:MAG: PKD domain-containing protein [Bacteroidota bacterium]|nr:PKD domain-containing protein [Bacteroidota bacterium]
MKLLLTLCTVFLLAFQINIYSQLPLGATAPDFTLTDIDGNSHNLYSYLAQGKMVIVEFSATWCGPCWNYMLGGALETFWEEHGPNGDNTAMVLYIEADFSTGMNDLLGLTGSSQGNWVDAIPFPIIDLQSGQNTAQQYQIAYYPTLYAICSDQTVWELGQVPASTWSAFLTSCTLAGDVEAITEADCYGQGGIEINYTGGYAPVEFDWSNGDDVQNLENVGAGTYSVTITENFGKFVVLEDIVIAGADEPIGVESSSIEEPLCNGSSNGNIALEIEGGTPGYEYDWSNGASTQNLTGVEAGNYTVFVTDDNGCTFQQAFSMYEPDAVEAEIETTTEDCDQENGTATLFITGGVGDYEISANGGEVVGDQIINLAQGSYTAFVEDANGCQWEQDFDIEFLPAPEVEIGQGQELTCLQLTTILTGFASSGSGDFEYFWTTLNGHIVSGQNNQSIVIDAEGTYNLLVTDFNSQCQTEAEMQVVATILLPEVTAGDDIPYTCENTQITVAGSGDSLNVITWSTTNGHIVSGESTYTPLVDLPGTYTISVFNPTTGCTNNDLMVVPNDQNPAAAAYNYQTNSLTLITTDQSSGSNINTWAWTFGDGQTSTLQSPVHVYAVEGIYDVCLTVQNGCGPSTSCLQVQVTPSGSSLNVSADVINVLCHGQATGAITVLVNGGSGNYTYLWTGPNGESFNTPTIDELLAGQWVVIIIDDQGNSFVGAYTINQPDALSITASTLIDNQCNGQNNGSIQVDIAGGVAPYLYSWNGGAQQSENFINQLPGGTYEVVVTDANGCNVLVGPYTIAEPAQISVDSVIIQHAINEQHNNGSISIEVTGGTAPYIINWSNGGTGNSITGLVPGEYTYTVIDAHGCLFGILNPIVISTSTSTTDVDASQFVSISPNPTKGNVIVKWTDLAAKDASLTLMTLDGRQLGTHAISGKEGVWNLNNYGLTNGLYVVLLQQDNQIVPIKLVIL